MTENKDLKFDKSGCLVSCASGWDKDSEGHDGVWRTNENGEHYFIRKGESVKDAYQRFIKSKEYRQNAKYEEIASFDKFSVPICRADFSLYPALLAASVALPHSM